ncbi:hypothetical protein [Sphingomonas sp. CROZ-RG-20F-R02-07]|uniref:hypothetical protein n=1 Tax=Sphingomonas sp. CROZ-RG-20F-R02-07 TaxID=2914832 RepID=UPI001F5A66BB|nr:hypothetical protein [Sphingomonas sp. CROZ-RG-20F-R02-07]
MTTGAQTFTAIHLVVIAILALIVIAGIVWGARLRRERRTAIDYVEEHRAEAEAMPAPVLREAERPVATQAQWQAQTQRPPEPQNDPLPETNRLADEPIAASAPMEASPATEAVTAAADGAPAADDQPVTMLKGLGPKLATRLGELGIVTVGDIAALSPAQAEALDAQLGAFTGRMARDRWIEQARLLAAGDRAGFEAAFGKL